MHLHFAAVIKISTVLYQLMCIYYLSFSIVRRKVKYLCVIDIYGFFV
jgi:hypothetical protein